MRVTVAALALCLAASCAMADNNNLDFQKAIQDIAAKMKETGDKAAEAVADTTQQVKQAIDKLKQEVTEHQKPIEDTISQAVHDVAETVKEGAEQVGDTIAQAAAAIKAELDHSANHEADPIEKKHCKGACTRIYMPVCGTDGKSYSNKCEMERITCEGGYLVEVKHQGKCEQTDIAVLPEGLEDPCWKACTDTGNAVCGSNGKTYTNKCLFEVQQCHMGGEGMLALAHDGECEEEKNEKDPSVCMKACTRDYRPVCGSDGKTYSNPCVFEIAQCVNGIMEDGTLTLAHRGKCAEAGKQCPSFCTMDYNPVCGTNGQTYGNHCGLRVDACKHPEQTIELAHEGECLITGSAANHVEAAKNDQSKMGIAIYAALIGGITILTAIVAMLAARRVQLRRFTSVVSAPAAPQAPPPGYSKLLTEDQMEDDPDELFAPEYVRKSSRA